MAALLKHSQRNKIEKKQYDLFKEFSRRFNITNSQLPSRKRNFDVKNQREKELEIASRRCKIMDSFLN